MGRLLWWSNIALALATLIAYLSPFVPPNRLWPIAFAGLAFPTFVLLHLVFFAWWAWKRSRRALLSLLLLAAGHSYILQYIGFGPEPKSFQEVEDTLTLVNYNLLGGGKIYSTDSAAFRQNLDQLSQEVFAGTDIIAFEESPLYPVVRSRLNETMESQGLKYHYYPGEPFISLHSRLPLMKPKVIDAFNDSNGLITALVSPKAGDTIRIYAVHLQSNSVRINWREIPLDAARNQKRVYFKLRTVAARYRSAARERLQQARQVTKAIRASRYPTIVLGDLNDTPLSYTVNEVLRAGLEDSFRESGSGLGVSYPGTIPGLRIDYIMGSEKFEFLASEVIDIGLSDHKPVRAVMKLQ